MTDNKQEARIIAPQRHNDGTALHPNLLASFESALCHHFGGFTRAEGFGGWFDQEHNRVVREAVYVYDIACDLSADTAVKLKHLAVNLLRDARQQAVYLRYPSGYVEFVE
jgi:hypothetical protein